MRSLKDEKQTTFLRASVCDICNFSCEYCATDLGMENHTPKCLNTKLLNVNQYMNNINQLAKYGFKTVSFTGGEPLLNPTFPEILSGCRQLFETIEVTTNGSRLLENIEVIKVNVDVLKISIDAFNPALRMKITNNPQAKQTTEIIEGCCKHGISTIGLNFVFMKQNKEELALLVDFASALKKKYGTNIYISVLDLYYSNGNKEFWKEQFVNLKTIRDCLKEKGIPINHRLRIGCDSYYFSWNDVIVNMKDSMSCTHRAEICENCSDYCQEGIYSLKHSASGWISVCPSNNIALGSLLNGSSPAETIDKYVDILNQTIRTENTGQIFCNSKGLEGFI